VKANLKQELVPKLRDTFLNVRIWEISKNFKKNEIVNLIGKLFLEIILQFLDISVDKIHREK